MEIATSKILRDTLKNASQKDLLHLVMRLARFKKENKELLTYLVFASEDEEDYQQQIKDYIAEELESYKSRRTYQLLKGVRKTLRNTKKYIRYSSSKETEIVLLLHFFNTLINLKPNILKQYTVSKFAYTLDKQIYKIINQLEDDLAHDYKIEYNEIKKSQPKYFTIY